MRQYNDADAVEKNTSAGSTALCASSCTVPMQIKDSTAVEDTEVLYLHILISLAYNTAEKGY